MKQTDKWICDTCGENIERVKDGWVEWLVRPAIAGEKRQGRGLRLVHHIPASPRKFRPGCQYDGNEEYRQDKSILYDLSLDCFLGPNGLMQLLSMLALDELPKDEILEMIKRLHIPGYEQARNHFDRAIAEGVFEPNMPKGYYWQSDIEAVLNFIEAEG